MSLSELLESGSASIFGLAYYNHEGILTIHRAILVDSLDILIVTNQEDNKLVVINFQGNTLEEALRVRYNTMVAVTIRKKDIKLKDNADLKAVVNAATVFEHARCEFGSERIKQKFNNLLIGS